jgi:hypothetical protein
MAAQRVKDIFVEYPARGIVKLRIKTDAGAREYVIPAAVAATLSLDLSAGGMPNHNTVPSQGAASEVFPDTLTLPLVTEPIRTMAMTEYPEGLAIEMKMLLDEPGGGFQRVRIPMFADTARAIVGALQQRLDKLEQDGGTSGRA